MMLFSFFFSTFTKFSIQSNDLTRLDSTWFESNCCCCCRCLSPENRIFHYVILTLFRSIKDNILNGNGEIICLLLDPCTQTQTLHTPTLMPINVNSNWYHSHGFKCHFWTPNTVTVSVPVLYAYIAINIDSLQLRVSFTLKCHIEL